MCVSTPRRARGAKGNVLSASTPATASGGGLPVHVDPAYPRKRVGPARQALKQVRLAEIHKRVLDLGDVNSIVAATREVLLEHPTLRCLTQVPTWDHHPKRWLALYGNLLREVAPGLAVTTEAQAQAFVSERIGSYLEQLDSIASGDFEPDKDHAAAARVQHDALRTMLEITGALRKGQPQTQVNVQQNVVNVHDEASRQAAADALASGSYKARRVEDAIVQTSAGEASA